MYRRLPVHRHDAVGAGGDIPGRSDRGSQYKSEQLQRPIADHGATCSMSRPRNCRDNAAMESFFSSLKTEHAARKTYRTRDEAKADVFDYIERAPTTPSADARRSVI